MPIAQSEQLFTIIKSLTKAEKRNFRLYVQRLQSNEDVMYVRLFDLLDKLEEYDESYVLDKMGDMPKAQFVNIKRHLYTQVLKSLRLIHENIESIKVREQIDFAHILYSKGLYLQAFKLLDRVKQMLPEGGHDLLKLEIIEFQKFIEERLSPIALHVYDNFQSQAGCSNTTCNSDGDRSLRSPTNLSA